MRDIRTYSINFSKAKRIDSHDRRIVIESFFDWQDEQPGDGKFRIVVVGECTETFELDERALTGTILLFPKRYSDDDKVRYESKVQALLQEMEGLTNISYPIADADWASRQARCNELWEYLNDFVTKECPWGDHLKECYQFDFKILHDGFVYIRKKYDLDCEPINVFGEQFPGDFRLMKKAYFYLKYALHKHKHHTDESDTLTSLVWNDANAGLAIIGQIKREVTRISRSQTNGRTDESEAQGVLGYLRSLIESCRYRELISPDVYSREIGWQEGMRQSSSAQSTKIAYQSGRTNEAKQVGRQWTAIVVAYLSLSTLTLVNLRTKSGNLNDDSFGGLVGLVNSGNALLVTLFFVTIFLGVYATNLIVVEFKLLDRNPVLIKEMLKLSWPKTITLVVFMIVATVLLFLSTL